MSFHKIEPRQSIHANKKNNPENVSRRRAATRSPEVSSGEDYSRNTTQSSFSNSWLEENSQSDFEESNNGSKNSTYVKESFKYTKKTQRTRTVSPISTPKIRNNSSNVDIEIEDKSYKSLFIGVVVVAALIMAVFFKLNDKSNNTKPNKNCSFSQLKSNFPNQDDYLWNALKVGIENILNYESQKPAVFLFLHNESSYVNDLIKKITVTSSNCFDPSLKPLEMLTEDFIQNSQQDYGYAIQKYKDSIKEGNVLIVAKLNKIPGEAARALHDICDTENPIVKRVIIFLTLITDGNGSAAKPVEIAENILAKLWGGSIKRSELDPLITRVTDQVFLLWSK